MMSWLLATPAEDHELLSFSLLPLYWRANAILRGCALDWFACEVAHLGSGILGNTSRRHGMRHGVHTFPTMCHEINEKERKLLTSHEMRPHPLARGRPFATFTFTWHLYYAM